MILNVVIKASSEVDALDNLRNVEIAVPYIDYICPNTAIIKGKISLKDIEEILEKKFKSYQKELNQIVEIIQQKEKTPMEHVKLFELLEDVLYPSNIPLYIIKDDGILYPLTCSNELNEVINGNDYYLGFIKAHI